MTGDHTDGVRLLSGSLFAEMLLWGPCIRHSMLLEALSVRKPCELIICNPGCMVGNHFSTHVGSLMSSIPERQVWSQEVKRRC